MLDAAIFLDKDGTLVEDLPYNVDPERIQLVPDARQALSLWAAAGFRLVVISNQSGVALGRFQEAALAHVEHYLRVQLASWGLKLDGFYYCPHHPQGVVPAYARPCACRKPAPGLVLRAAAELRLDCRRSWFVGDILHDVEAGNRAGCRTVLVARGSETQWDLSGPRVPDRIAASLLDAASQTVASAPHPYRRNITCEVSP